MIKFLKFVEITTKSISLLAFMTGAAYCAFRYSYIDIKNAAIFLIAMLLFDMATTAINNFIDKRDSGKVPHFSAGISLFMIIIMIAASMALGIYLTVQCGIFVLLVGTLCFAAGILYTFGPAPISRTPYGEIISGTVMGGLIPALVIYIGAPNGEFLYFQADLSTIAFYMGMREMALFVIVTLPLMLTIAGIMLANNICDVEKDIAIKRYTLPYYIGNKKAVRLFSGIYYASYAFIILAAAIGAAPVWSLFCLLSFIPVYKNLRVFRQKQIKNETFILSVKNFIGINLSFAVLIASGAVVNIYF